MSPTPEFAHDHDVRLYQGAQELFPALVEAMDAALSDIQFETYIFDFTGAGAAWAKRWPVRRSAACARIWWWTV